MKLPEKKLLLSLLFGAVLTAPALHAQEQAAARVVSTAAVRTMQIAPTMMVSGQVQSKYQSNLSTGVDGRLDWIAEPGQQVQAGAVLARLDLKPLQLRAAELQAQLKRSHIQSQRLDKELTRQRSLLSKALVSQTLVDQTQAEADLARADIELSQASLAQLQDQLNRAELKAPFDGVVSQRFHQIGEEISRSAPLLQLVNLAQLEVRVYAPLQYAAYIQPGQQVSVFDQQGQRSLQVQSTIPVSDNRSQTFELRLQAGGSGFQVGQLVSVGIPTAVARDSLVIHRDALVLAQQQHTVFKVAGNKAQQVKVVLGQGQGEWLQVEGAISSGDQLVVRGADTLTDGAAVRVLSNEEFKLAGSRAGVQ
ncbi:efflux RND transporter periplasmic adaptor subunit [Rheinheimera sp.]|uniref:efflux RND transporter periplasmic adaptor subunit n=1 Tax=Rheinheimera sp. TaxID=1869214 RepID=UPI003D2A2F3A